MKSTKIWKDMIADAMEIEYRFPAGKGDRLIVCQVGSAESGLLENCLLLFRGSKSSKPSYYHTEMNWSMFSDCCESRVFSAMKRTKKKSVLVLDRATYQTIIDEEDKRPATSWNKTRLADSVARWEGISDDWFLTWRVIKTKNE